MSDPLPIQIRCARPDDKPFILSLAPPLVEFGPPPWRNAAAMTATDVQVLTDRIATDSARAAIFIAEDAQGAPLGFIHLNTTTDYYTRSEHAHIADLVVAPQGEGHGVGQALMTHAETWARALGFHWLTLSVFVENHHARALYRHMGYGEDIMGYIKELD